MTLKKKILIGYGLSFAFMGLVVALAVINLVALGKATDAILSENYRSILAAENMVDALERQDSGTLLVLMGEVEEGTALFQKTKRFFSNGWAAPKTTSPSAGKLTCCLP